MTQLKPLILLIDDESKIRRLLGRALEQEGFDVVSADSAEDGLSVMKKNLEKPDLIILDYMMPDMDVLMFLEALRKEDATPVIMLSALSETAKKTKALELGADDYVVKPFSMEELIARMRAVLRRVSDTGARKREKIFANGPLVMNQTKRICRYKDKDVRLADTEFRLLGVLLQHPGKIFMHEDLLRQVWGAEYIGELNYLRVSFSRIRKKLTEAGLDGSVIASYSGIGYYMEELEEDL